MDEYDRLLAEKEIKAKASGFDVSTADLNPALFDWQQQLDWLSLRRGKSAIFADCGLGKTPMLMEYGQQVNRHTNKPILIVAPLAVARQTAQDEAPKFGYTVNLCKEQADVKPGLNITNYERIHLFSPRDFAAIILDESSILKGGIDSKTYQRLATGYKDTPYKLCCTATPAPNDMLELLAHIEFLGVMDGNAVKACFFQHDGGDTKKWVLRPHAEEAFWRFVASWAVMLRSPSDIGYDGARYHLPELYRHNSTVKLDHQEGASEGAQLIMPGFQKPARTMTERRNARKLSLEDRVALTAEIVASDPGKQWVIWCSLNPEGEAITKAIPGAVEVAGRHDDEVKADRMLAFAHGDIQVLVTKAKIAGRGMNWQNCSHTVSCGLSDSYEDLYQYERRFWRYGQDENVHHHIVTSELDANVIKNIARKEAQHEHMMTMMIGQMHTAMIEAVHGVETRYDPYDPQLPMLLPDWLQSEVLA